MNELEKILNESETPKPTEPKAPKPVEKPTPAANKANGLAAQEKAIAAASVGGVVFRSPVAFLATSLENKKIKI
jgi:hypothetical protein